MRRAVLEQKRTPLVIGAPNGGAVDEGFREDQHVTGRHRRLHHPIRVAAELRHVTWHQLEKVRLVAARHTGETTSAGRRIGQIPGRDGEPVTHHAVVIAIPMIRLVAEGTAVQPVLRGVLAHEDAIVVIDTQPRADQLDEVGQNLGVVDQIEVRLAPFRHRGRAPKRPIVCRSRPDRVRPFDQRITFIGSDHVLQDDEPLQIEQEFLLIRHHAQSTLLASIEGSVC